MLYRLCNRKTSETIQCVQVKGGHVTLIQLAEQWLMRSSKILQNPFSRDAYVAVLKEADQFLWAGSEMDPVGFYIFSLFFWSLLHLVVCSDDVLINIFVYFWI